MPWALRLVVLFGYHIVFRYDKHRSVGKVLWLNMMATAMHDRDATVLRDLHMAGQSMHLGTD